MLAGRSSKVLTFAAISCPPGNPGISDGFPSAPPAPHACRAFSLRPRAARKHTKAKLIVFIWSRKVETQLSVKSADPESAHLSLAESIHTQKEGGWRWLVLNFYFKFYAARAPCSDGAGWDQRTLHRGASGNSQAAHHRTAYAGLPV
jgi:hypothetical protein